MKRSIVLGVVVLLLPSPSPHLGVHERRTPYDEMRAQALSPARISYAGTRNFIPGTPLFFGALPEESVVLLRGGRKLGFKIYGDRQAPESKTVLYFHGNGGSRLEPGTFNRTGLENHRIIAIDRPGIGLSSFYRHHGLRSWPQDIRDLIDQLEIGRFYLAAYSNGAPYAVASAFSEALGPRILGKLGLISPLGPLDGPGRLAAYPPRLKRVYTLAQYYDWSYGVARPLLRFYVSLLWKSPIHNDFLWPSVFRDNVVRPESFPDQIILGRISPQQRENWIEVFKQGSRGWLRDLASLTKPWPLDMSPIKVPVRIWHGIEDRVVPWTVAHQLAEELSAELLPKINKGHRFIVNEFADIVLKMTEESGERDARIFGLPTAA